MSTTAPARALGPTLLSLAGVACAPPPEPPSPPAPPTETPYGLDPDECVEGSFTVGLGLEALGRVLTVEDALAFRCFSDRLTIGGVEQLPDLTLPNLVYVGTLEVWDRGGPIELALPQARTIFSLWTSGPVRVTDIGGLDTLVSLNLLEPGPDPDLSAFRNLRVIDQLRLDGVWETYDIPPITTTQLFLSGAGGELDGLEGLTAGSVAIRDSSLTSLHGLRGFRALGDLSLTNSSIGSLAGLEGVETIEGFARLAFVEGLTGLEPLSGLASTGSLTVEGMTSLSVMELPALDAVDGTLAIVGNPILERVELPLLTTLTGDLVFQDNPALPACEVERLAERLQASGFTGAVTNTGNDTEAICSAPGASP